MTSRAALELGAFPVIRGVSHGFGSELGPETGRLVQIVNGFIAKQVG